MENQNSWHKLPFQISKKVYYDFNLSYYINILLFTQLGFVGLYFVLCYSLYKYDVMYDSKMPILATSPLYKL